MSIYLPLLDPISKTTLLPLNTPNECHSRIELLRRSSLVFQKQSEFNLKDRLSLSVCAQIADGPKESSGRRPAISVVGIPDPITWIRCKVIMFALDLYFELDVNSEEFERGVKQALVHVSNKMSNGRYHELKGIVSNEMLEYVEKRCGSLTDAQRKQLGVQTDDIVFVLPEDISVVFDQYGRKFCYIVMRFWILSSHEGPDDPEGTKIFKVGSSEDGGPQKKIVTAVYDRAEAMSALSLLKENF
uniref:Si:dkey-82o10.4 n=1 Tax=Astatotilapia calliptera TaxID=8154 RepID=A0A3P8P1Y0_ASTCA